MNQTKNEKGKTGQNVYKKRTTTRKETTKLKAIKFLKINVITSKNFNEQIRLHFARNKYFCCFFV